MATNERECPFCEIVEGDDPDARVVYRDQHVVAFFPTEPAVLGHTLLIPRRHLSTIWEVDDELACVLGQASVKLAHAVRRAMLPEGLNIIQSNGSAATQTVPHVHFHIVPRWIGDPVGRIWPPETSYTEGQKDDAWDAIRRECGLLGK
jgi:histidine triad (HIT) family protein